MFLLVNSPLSFSPPTLFVPKGGLLYVVEGRRLNEKGWEAS